MAFDDPEAVDQDAVDQEAVFEMVEPAKVIELLARQFVSEQIAMANFREMLAPLPANHPQTEELRAEVADFVELWTTKQLPNLAASFRLALEVLDTYGPDGVDVADGVDAAIWNNKYFVWLKEFGGTPPK